MKTDVNGSAGWHPDGVVRLLTDVVAKIDSAGNPNNEDTAVLPAITDAETPPADADTLPVVGEAATTETTVANTAVPKVMSVALPAASSIAAPFDGDIDALIHDLKEALELGELATVCNLCSTLLQGDLDSIVPELKTEALLCYSICAQAGDTIGMEYLVDTFDIDPKTTPRAISRSFVSLLHEFQFGWSKHLSEIVDSGRLPEDYKTQQLFVEQFRKALSLELWRGQNSGDFGNARKLINLFEISQTTVEDIVMETATQFLEKGIDPEAMKTALLVSQQYLFSGTQEQEAVKKGLIYLIASRGNIPKNIPQARLLAEKYKLKEEFQRTLKAAFLCHWKEGDYVSAEKLLNVKEASDTGLTTLNDNQALEKNFFSGATRSMETEPRTQMEALSRIIPQLGLPTNGIYFELLGLICRQAVKGHAVHAAAIVDNFDIPKEVYLQFGNYFATKVNFQKALSQCSDNNIGELAKVAKWVRERWGLSAGCYDTFCAAEIAIDLADKQINRVVSIRDGFEIPQSILNRDDKIVTAARGTLIFKKDLLTLEEYQRAAQFLPDIGAVERSRARTIYLEALRRGKLTLAKGVADQFGLGKWSRTDGESESAACEGAIEILLGSKDLENSGDESATEIMQALGIPDKVQKSTRCDAVEFLLARKMIAQAAMLTSKYDLSKEVASRPTVQESIERYCINELEAGGWVPELAILHDAGLLPYSVRMSPKVRDAVYAAMVKELNRDKVNSIRVANLLTTFQMDRPELTERTLARVSEVWKQGFFQQGDHLLRVYGISSHTRGFHQLVEPAKAGVLRLVSDLNFEGAEELLKKVNVTKDALLTSGLAVVAQRFRKGDFDKATKIAEWLGIPASELPHKLTKQDVALGITSLVSGGWSDQWVTFVQVFNITGPELRTNGVDPVAGCLASDIRAGAWDMVAKAQEMFAVADEQVATIAAQQLEDVLATGNTKHAKAILERLSLSPQELEEIAVRAAIRAYQIADTARVDRIKELFPQLGTSASSVHARPLVESAFETMVRSGWKGDMYQHFEQTFGYNRLDLKNLEEAALQGIVNEINLGELDNALKIPASLNVNKKLIALAMLQASEKALMKNKQRLGSLGLSLEKQIGSYSILMVSDNGSLVENEIRSRIGKGEFRAADPLGAFFGYPESEIDLIAGEVVIANLRSGKIIFADEILQSLKLSRLSLSKLVKDPAALRAELNIPQTKLTLGEVMGAVISRGFKDGVDLEGLGEGRKIEKFHRSFREDEALTRKILDDASTVHSQHPIENRRQDKGFTCGAACARMGVKAATGIEYAEAQLVTWLGTNQDTGTRLANFSKLHEAFPNIETLVSAQGSYDKIRQLLRAGYVVLVNYHIGIEPHYGVVRAISNDAILLSDPNSGPNTAIPLNELDWRGGYDHARVQGGFVALRVRGERNPDRFPKSELVELKSGEVVGGAKPSRSDLIAKLAGLT